MVDTNQLADIRQIVADHTEISLDQPNIGVEADRILKTLFPDDQFMVTNAEITANDEESLQLKGQLWSPLGNDLNIELTLFDLDPSDEKDVGRHCIFSIELKPNYSFSDWIDNCAGAAPEGNEFFIGNSDNAILKIARFSKQQLLFSSFDYTDEYYMGIFAPKFADVIPEEKRTAGIHSKLKITFSDMVGAVVEKIGLKSEIVLFAAINRTENYTTLSLSADINAKALLNPFKIELTQLGLEIRLNANGFQLPDLFLEGALVLGKQRIQIGSRLILDEKRLVFSLSTSSGILDSIDDLAALAGFKSENSTKGRLSDLLPTPLSALGTVYLPELTADINLWPLNIKQLTFSIATKKEISLIEDIISIRPLLQVEIIAPFNVDHRSINAYLLGNWMLGETSFNTFVSIPEFRIAAEMEIGQSLDVSEVLEKILPGIDLPHGIVQLVDMDFEADLKAKSFEASIDIASNWEVKIAEKAFAFRELTLEVAYADKKIQDCNMTGLFTMVDINFLINAQYNKGVGWILYGGTAPGEIINITEIGRTLLPDGITLPSQVPDIAFTDLFLSTDARREFIFKARTAGTWEIMKGFSIHSGALDLKLITKPKGDEKPFTGMIEGVLTICDVATTLKVDMANNLQFYANVKEINVAAILEKYAPDIKIPDELPVKNIIISSLKVLATPQTGAFSFMGNASANFKMPIGEAELTVKQVEFKFERDEKKKISCLIKVKASGQLSPHVRFPLVTFAFEYDQKSWKLGGELSLVIFERYLHFKAGAVSTKGAQELSFESDFAAIVMPGYFEEITEGKLAQLFKRLKELNYIDEQFVLLKTGKKLDKLNLEDSYTKDQQDSIINLLKKIHSDTALHLPNFLKPKANENIASFNLKKFAIKLKREKGKLKSWEVGGVADLSILNPVEQGKNIISITKGALRLSGEGNEKAITFSAEEAILKPLAILPGIPSALAEGLVAGLGQLAIKNKEKKWSLEASTYLRMVDEELNKFPPAAFITAVFPKPNKGYRQLEGSIALSSEEGIVLKLRNNAFKLEPNVTAMVKEPLQELINIIEPLAEKDEYIEKILKFLEEKLKELPDIGKAYLCLQEVGIVLKDSKTSKCSISLAVGLPAHLNELLFEKLPKPFNQLNGILTTYKEDSPSTSVMTATLLLSPKGISGNLGNFPPFNWQKISEILKKNTEGIEKILVNGIKFINENGKEKKITDKGIGQETIKQVLLDFDGLLDEDGTTYGEIAINIPKFHLSFKKNSFSFSGGYEIKSKQLMIPISPTLAKLLTLLPEEPFEMSQLREIANFLPYGIPLRNINFFNNNKLNFGNEDGIETWLKAILPKAIADDFAFPTAFKKFAEQHAGEVINKLPQRFKEYLNIILPKAFSFDINITPDGSFSIAIDTGKITLITANELVEKELASSKNQATFLKTNLIERGYLDRRGEVLMHFNLTDLAEFKKSLDKEFKGKAKAIYTYLGDRFTVPIQFLMVNPQMPFLFFGIRLWKFGLGTALSNQFFRLDLSAEVDMFDVATLGTSLFLPDKPVQKNEETQLESVYRLMLPNSHTFARTIEVKDLLMFIFFKMAGPVPIVIPIPVFFQKIHASYFALEGLESEFNLGFEADFSATELLKEVSKLISFFNQKGKFLEVGSYGLLGRPEYENANASAPMIIKAGPTYVQLPGIMGYEGDSLKNGKNILVGSKKQFSVNIFDLAKLSLNFFKGGILPSPSTIPTKIRTYENGKEKEVKTEQKKPFNYLIEYLPLEHRFAIKKIKLFYLFDLHLAWAFATPDEFSEIVYPLMLDAYNQKAKTDNLPMPPQTSPASYLLDLLAKEDDISLPPGEDQGVVLFLRGGLDIANQIILEGAIGLSISEHKGFRTGIALKGKVFDWVETESFFFIKINPQSQKEFIKVLGNTFLRVFGREILKGQLEVTPKKMAFAGMLDVFPKGFPTAAYAIQLKGFANGLINKDIFKVEAIAGLQLGTFRAGLAIDIDITKGNQRFIIDMAFANATFNLKLSRTVQGANTLIMATLDANAFNLLKLNGALQIKREPSILSLTGHTSLTMPNVRFLHLEMDYNGEINGAEGFISFSAQLTENCYILSPECRVTGGAAFLAWFAGDHAGDFVVSIGGYHPAFNVPEHYPKVPRLGIQWEIDQYTHISGEAYLAITPNAIMAGAKLSLVYHKGNIRAWFHAYAHFLSQWKPVYYEAIIGINLGASITIWFFGYKTITISVGAKLHLWGPPTGGYLEFQIAKIKIAIPFGNQERGSQQKIKDWEDFQKEFLPKKEKILKINPEGGVISVKDINNKTNNTWIVRPDEFSYSIFTAIPASKVESPMYDSKKKLDTKKKIHIKPLDGKEIISTLDLTLKGKKIESKPLFSNVPAALWGPSNDKPLDSSQSLIKGLITGLQVSPTTPTIGEAIKVKESNLGYTECKQRLPKIAKEQPMTLKTPKGLPELQKVIDSPQRKTTFEDIAKLELAYPENYYLKNNELNHIEETMKTEWLDCPVIIE